jgi:hypothetical protein
MPGKNNGLEIEWTTNYTTAAMVYRWQITDPQFDSDIDAMSNSSFTENISIYIQYKKDDIKEYILLNIIYN